ncbi:MAG: cell division protein FtsZ [Bacteroidales bacterium]|nr:cell division protein FtsZ [Bacteroidales bacterium]
MAQYIEDELVPQNIDFNTARIKVIGVGGGGSNAVCRMYEEGIKDVEFLICNTDKQALDGFPAIDKLQLGTVLTKGLGAGCDPEKGRNAAIESIEEIKKSIGSNIEMVFITAGMGGGTGTGAAPVIAKVSREMGLLTIGVVTTPFKDDGYETLNRAYNGLEELKKYVDSLLIIDNEKIYDIYGQIDFISALKEADNVLTTAVKGITEIITVRGHINVDMADVKMVMKDSGMALMGMGKGFGENRAMEAVEEAFKSPLLNDFDLRTAKNALVNISSNENDGIKAAELKAIMEYIKEYTGKDIEKFKRGVVIDNSLEPGSISITVVATGFTMHFEPPRVIKNKISEENLITVEDTPEDSNRIELTPLINNDNTASTGNLRHININDISIYTDDINISDYENETALSRLTRAREQRIKEEQANE